MIKIIKNSTNVDIFIPASGVNILANGQHVISAAEYPLWVDQIDDKITSGSLVVNDGSADLDSRKGRKLINSKLAKDVFFDDIPSNLPATSVQGAIEELKKGYNLVSTVTSSTVIKTTSNTSDVLMQGMTLSPAAGTHIVHFNGQYSSTVNSITAQAGADLSAAITALKELTSTVTGHAASFGSLSGETLVAGVYTITGAGSLSDSLTLNGQNNPNALFVFRFTGAFNVTAAASISLINGANASNVFFVSDGAIVIGAGANLKGNFFSLGSAAGLGALCTLTGRLATTAGAITLDSSTVIKPTTSTLIALGSIDGFALFTSLGSVTNTAISSIVGHVGTNLGSVVGISLAMITGTIYLPTSSTSTIAFSLYANGILIPNSKRVITRTQDVSGDFIALHAVVPTSPSQTIEVRINVTIGTITIGNRTLTSLRVSG